MKPFGLLLTARTRDPALAVQRCGEFIKKYAHVSASKHVTLEEVSWLASLVSLGLDEAKSQLAKEEKGNVVTVVAQSSLEPTDHAA